MDPLSDVDKLVISVQDTGIGIKNKDRIKLFKLFGKLQNTKGMNTQGIGLGLVISENIVNQFQGKIGVKSKYGSGTTFAFSFNLIKQNQNPTSFMSTMTSKVSKNKTMTMFSIADTKINASI